jgi:pimeloyl-[acyl-carrier protein] methyl ester esterase
VSVQGQGPDLVLLHGWGMSLGVWDGIADSLATDFRVHRVDLPGHGQSPAVAGLDDVERLADLLLACLPAEAVWLGWSLGGLAAIAAASRCGVAVRGLVLVAASPRFVKGPGWPAAVEPAVLDAFAEGLDRDYEQTLRRFLALEVHGSAGATGTLRTLRRALTRRPPSKAALRGGLGMLREADLRRRLADLDAPLAVILGERDLLVPKAVAQGIEGLRPDATIRVIPGAGHAPFISRPASFLMHLAEVA